MKTATKSVSINGLPVTLKEIAEKTGRGYVTLFLRYKKFISKFKREPNYIELMAEPLKGRPRGTTKWKSL